MDRTRLHILFFDQDPSTGLQTLCLLRKCSYRVTSVKSAEQLVQTVTSGQVDIDLILTEMGQLSEDRSYPMLKQILLQEKLSHIPVVVMSDCDEMAVVAKCLRLGAVDYLVKPLRLNEVMNLWTHAWRRRRMLGLDDKHESRGSLSSPVDSSLTDTHESNNANTLCHEESAKGDRKASTRALQAVDTSPHLELSLRLSSHFTAEKPLEQIPDASNPPVAHVLPPCSNGMELRIGQTSAFVTYTKHSVKPSSEQSVNVGSESTAGNRSHDESNDSEGKEQMDSGMGGPDTRFMANPVMCSQTLQPTTLQVYNQHGGMLSINPGSIFSYYSVAPGVTAPPFVGFPSWPPTMMVAAVPVPITVPLPPPSSMAACNIEMTAAERREAALNKFRLKRKGRCFEKKIRYASRKKLAEQRPRVRGQFVKRGHVVSSMIEMQADSAHECMDEEEQDADDEQGFTNSSPDESMVGSSKVG